MAENVCHLCGETVLGPLLRLHVQLEKSMMRELRELHPEWFSGKNQDMNKVLEAYRQKHTRFRDEARELRMKLESSYQRMGRIDAIDGEVDEESF